MPSSEILMLICTWNWEIILVFNCPELWGSGLDKQIIFSLPLSIWIYSRPWYGCLKIWLLETEMFSPLLQLETLCKTQRIQNKVGCSKDISSQELIMLCGPCCHSGSVLSISDTFLLHATFSLEGSLIVFYHTKDRGAVVRNQTITGVLWYQIRMQPQHSVPWTAPQSGQTG